jgi:hypothetical protein
MTAELYGGISSSQEEYDELDISALPKIVYQAIPTSPPYLSQKACNAFPVLLLKRLFFSLDKP